MAELDNMKVEASLTTESLSALEKVRAAHDDLRQMLEGGPLVDGILDNQIAGYLDRKLTPQLCTDLVARLKDDVTRLVQALVGGVDPAVVGPQLCTSLRDALLPIFRRPGVDEPAPGR